MIDIRIPGDKSISHRALMLAALADGRSSIRGILDSADIRSTANVLRALGVDVPDLGAEVVAITGHGLRRLHTPGAVLHCGNSGTTARLMMGIAAAQNFHAIFDGDASLRTRPMRRVTDLLAAMGAGIRELGEPDRLPLEITGAVLRAVGCDNEKSSAQVKSAVLLAALCGGVRATVSEPVHSRDHTERMLGAMGVPLRTVVHDGSMQIEMDPVAGLRPLEIDVPGDFSSAAFFLARGLLGGAAIRIARVGVNATRTGMLDVIRKMQGIVHVTDRAESCSEPVATIVAEPSVLRAVHVEGAEIPHMIDEVPILAVLAARAEGETTIRGAGELRLKETDRLRAVATNLRVIGGDVVEMADGLVIRGSQAPLRGHINTHGDHRIAMAFGILASIPGNQITMDDASCVAVSFPTFWHQLEECTG